MFTGESLILLNLLRQKAKISGQAVWDENFGVLPKIKLVWFPAASATGSRQSLILQHGWEGILQLQCQWDKLDVALGCSGDTFKIAYAGIFTLSWTMSDREMQPPTDLHETIVDRIRLIAQANANPLLRLPAVRNFLQRELTSAQEQGFRDFLLEVFLSLCCLPPEPREIFDFEHFRIRAQHLAKGIIVRRAACQVPPAERSLIRKCAEKGSSAVLRQIHGLCAMIWGFRSGQDPFPMQSIKEIPYFYTEIYRTNGNIEVSELTPAESNSESRIRFSRRRDSYKEVFPNFTEAAVSRAFSLAEAAEQNPRLKRK